MIECTPVRPTVSPLVSEQGQPGDLRQRHTEQADPAADKAHVDDERVQDDTLRERDDREREPAGACCHDA
jgi:hypothetical protein